MLLFLLEALTYISTPFLSKSTYQTRQATVKQKKPSQYIIQKSYHDDNKEAWLIVVKGGSCGTQLSASHNSHKHRQSNLISTSYTSTMRIGLRFTFERYL